MEKINEVMAKILEQPMNKSLTPLSEHLHRTEQGIEVSRFKDGLTPEGGLAAIKKLKSAFPQLPESFYDVFNSRIKELRIGDQRLMAAVNHVVDTCVYPQPTVAQFLSYDERIVYLNYEMMLKKLNEMGGDTFHKLYQKIAVSWSDKPHYVSKSDVEKYKL